MRIGFFTLSMYNGGAERVAALLSGIWSRLGHEVVLLTQQGATDRDFPHQCVAREVIDMAALDSACMKALQERYQFDLCIFNDGIDAWHFEKNVRLVQAVGCKVVVILHHTFNNWCYTTGNYRELGYRELLSSVDAVVAVEDILALWWIQKGARTFHIPNPVAFKPVAMRGCPKECDLIWIGRVGDFAKRPELAIEAFGLIHRQVPEAQLYMLGTTTKALERRLLKGLPREVASNVHFTGFVANAGDYLSRAKLCLFTSQTEVTVPQVVLESLANGVPTIAYKIPPMLGGVGGVELVASSEEMAERAVQILKDDNRRSSLSSEACRAAQERCDESILDEKWKTLLLALQSNDRLQELGAASARDLSQPAVYNRLLAEVDAGYVAFTSRWLPKLLAYLRWRSRLNLCYMGRRVVAKLRKGV